MSKFGIGQAVRRVEDQRFTTGSGQFVADMALPRQCYGVAVLSPHAHAIIKRVDVSAAKAAPGVLCVLTGADAATDKIGGIPPFFMPECLGRAAGLSDHATGAARRPRPLHRRPRRLRRRGNRGAGARRRRAGRRSTTNCLPAVVDLEQAAQPAAPKIWEQCPGGNVGRHDRVRRQGRGRCGFRQRQACRLGATDQQPGHRQPDRAARCARRLRRRRRQIHALHNVAGSAQRPRRTVRVGVSRAGIEDQSRVAGRRRRLRHEGQHLSRRRAGAVGLEALRPAGQMDGDAQREPVARQSRPRSARPRRACARRRRQVSRPFARAPIRRSAPIGGAPRPRRCSGR